VGDTRTGISVCWGIGIYDLSWREIAERNAARVQQARDQLRSELRFSVADEEKLDRLKKSRSIAEHEFIRLRTKLVA
jgi:hypothetical protein